MVVNNPNNWHWVDKNCINWAKEYFQNKLIGISTGNVNDEKYSYIKKITSIEGDCEVNQRKGKVISLYDLQMVLIFEGHVDNNEKVEGSISIPEISFDSEVNDYQFIISVYKESMKLNEIKQVIKDKIVPEMIKIFQNFGKDLLIEHGNDIQIDENKVTSNYTKSNQQDSYGNERQEKNEVIKKKKDLKLDNKNIVYGTGNVSKIHIEPSFNASSNDIYDTFIDINRMMAWSRGSLNIIKHDGNNKLVEGDKYELFGGNIESEIIKLTENKNITINWRLKDWNSKITSKIEIEIHESKEYNESKLQINWSGIPVGEEDKCRDNFENYYVKAIKLTFGYGAVL